MMDEAIRNVIQGHQQVSDEQLAKWQGDRIEQAGADAEGWELPKAAKHKLQQQHREERYAAQ